MRMDMRVAAYAVVTDDAGRVLLSRWIQARRPAWTMPGGGLEPGEHPETAARREVEEETGYVVELDGILGVDSDVIPAAKRLQVGASTPLQALRIVYRAHIVGGELRDETDGSTDRAEWFTLDEVRALRRVELVGTALRMAGIRLRD